MHRSGENISMTLKSTMEKWRIVLYLGWHRLRDVLYSFTLLCKMVRSSIAFLSPRSFKEDLEQIKFLDVDLMSWSYGIALVTILALLLLISWTPSLGNIQEKIKNGIQGPIFLQLTGLTQRVIQQIRIIPKFRTNISALMYWHQIMAIMRLSQIID